MSPNPSENGRSISPALANFFVHSRFGLQVMLLTLVFLTLAGTFAYQAFYQQYIQIMEIFQVVDQSMQHELVVNDIVIRNLVLLGLSILTYIILMVILIIRTQHKYEGPVVAIQRVVTAIGRGDYSQRIVTRKGDALQDLVYALNDMVDALEKRHGNQIPPTDQASGS
jgi:methyl-accepting chemotaxis protein